MDDRVRQSKKEISSESLDNTEETKVTRRAEIEIICTIRLLPSQVDEFQERLEDLCNEFLNI